MRTWSEKSAGAGHLVAAAAMLVSAVALSVAELPGGDAPAGVLLGVPSVADCPTRGGASATRRPGCAPADARRLSLGALFSARRD